MFLFQVHVQAGTTSTVVAATVAAASLRKVGSVGGNGYEVEVTEAPSQTSTPAQQSASVQDKKPDDSTEIDKTKVALNLIFNGGSALLNLFTFLNANFFKIDFLQEKIEAASDVLTRTACGVQGAILAVDAWAKKNFVTLVSNSLDLPIVAFSDPSEIWCNRGWSQGGSQSEPILNEFIDENGKHYSADFSKTGWIDGLKTSFKVYGKIIKELVSKPSTFNKSSHSLFVASAGQIFFTTLKHLGSKIIGPVGRDVFGTLVDYGLVLAKKSAYYFWAGTTWVGAAVVDAMKRLEGLFGSIPCLTNLSFASDRGASVLYTLGNLFMKPSPEGSPGVQVSLIPV